MSLLEQKAELERINKNLDEEINLNLDMIANADDNAFKGYLIADCQDQIDIARSHKAKNLFAISQILKSQEFKDTYQHKWHA